MPRRSRRPILVVALGLLLGPPHPASAASLDGRIFIDSDILGFHVERTPSASAGPLSDSESPSNLAGSALASFEADYGILHARGQMDVLTTGSLTTQSIDSGSSASAAWHDMLTITAPGRSGMPGSFRPVIRVSGSLAASAAGSDPPFSSFAEASAIAGFFSSVPGAGRSQQRSILCHADAGDSVCAPSGDSFGIWTLDPVPFQFASSFAIDVSADAGVFLRTVEGGTAHASADLGNSVEWLGISGVADSNGLPVVGYSVTAQSGFDYVPEPETPWLAAVVVLALARLRRRA
jgi:hypothetical protein